MGSESDKEIMKSANNILADFKISFQSHILSAHRAPNYLHSKMKEWNEQGVKVFIAAAGLAAHLPGVVASLTTRPVIGVPLKSETSLMSGLDSLCSIVQMPSGVPVATVGVNNASNAAWLALQILGISSNKIEQDIQIFRKQKESTYASL